MTPSRRAGRYRIAVATALAALITVGEPHQTPALTTPAAAVSSRCPLEGTNLVRDGSFEEPHLRAGTHFRIVNAGGRIGPWSVSGQAVDHMAPRYWEAAHGEQSLDVNSCGPATVSQRVPTRPGDSYQLCFAIAGNPDAPPERKRLEILWDGAVVDTVEFNATSATRERMGWTYHRYVVRAAAHDAVVAFRSVTPGCYGPVLDDVTLQRLPDQVASCDLATEE